MLWKNEVRSGECVAIAISLLSTFAGVLVFFSRSVLPRRGY